MSLESLGEVRDVRTAFMEGRASMAAEAERVRKECADLRDRVRVLEGEALAAGYQVAKYRRRSASASHSLLVAAGAAALFFVWAAASTLGQLEVCMK